MATVELTARMRPAADQPVVVRAVTVTMGTVVGLTFLFGFGNVLNLALRLGVPVWVAPLVAPAVDLSILGLLLGTRHLALHGATPEQLQPARRLLIFASLATLALNIADPIVAGDYGKAAFDAVGPLLLIGWAEVGPGLLQAITAVSHEPSGTRGAHSPAADSVYVVDAMSETGGMGSRQAAAHRHRAVPNRDHASQQRPTIGDDDLLERARQEDTRHRAVYQRPISAETLRRHLRVGAKRSRHLVALVRAEARAQAVQDSRLATDIAPDRDDASALASA